MNIYKNSIALFVSFHINLYTEHPQYIYKCAFWCIFNYLVAWTTRFNKFIEILRSITILTWKRCAEFTGCEDNGVPLIPAQKSICGFALDQVRLLAAAPLGGGWIYSCDCSMNEAGLERLGWDWLAGTPDPNKVCKSHYSGSLLSSSWSSQQFCKFNRQNWSIFSAS